MTFSFANTLPLLWLTAVKASVILAAAGLLSVAFRRASAAARFLTWQLGIVGVLALTAASFFVTPRWRVLPSGPGLFAPPVATQRAPCCHPERSEGSAVPNARATPAPTATPAWSHPERSEGSAVAVQPAIHLPPVSTTTVLETLWLAGAALVLLRLLAGALATKWLTRRAEPVHAARWAQLNETMSMALGLAHPVAILKSARAATPMTFGVFAPVVLLPADADDWTEERRRVVLLHELAHVRRFDAVTNVLATAVCAIYWFNPLVWYAVHRMWVEAECACDDWVLRAGIRASSYADHLLELVRTLGQLPTPTTALPMAQRSTFEGRLLAILEPRMNRNGVRRGQAALLTLAIAALAVPLAAMTSVARAPAPNSPLKQSSTVFRSEPKTVDGSVSRESVDPRGAIQAKAIAPVLAASATQQPISQGAVDALIAATKDADAGVRLATIKTLAESGDPRAVAALSEALKSDKDPAVRRAAAWGLGNLGDPHAVPALGAALKSDADVEVRRTAVWALGEIGDRSASDQITPALSDKDADVRKQAVWALGELGDRSAAPSVERLLNDNDAATREQAVWALGEMGARQSVSAIAGVLRDTSATVRNEAAWALGEIGERSSVEPLIHIVDRDPDERVRETAVWALGEMGDQIAVPALATALSDTAGRVVAMAAWAIGEIGPHSAPPALMSVASNADVDARRNAVWAMGQIEDPASVPALRQALKDSDRDVKRSAMHALAHVGDVDAESALADMLKDSDPEVRKEAAAALGGHSGAEPRPRPRPQPRPQPRPFGW